MIFDKHKPEDILVEKFFKPKTFLMFVVLWAVIFIIIIASINFSKVERITKFKEQCDSLGIRLEECKEIWEANPPLITPP